MLKIYVGSLPPDVTDGELTALFEPHGRVRSMHVARDVFSGKCKGFAFIEMEGHEARAAIAALNGMEFKGRPIKVNEERPRDKRGAGPRRR